MRSVVCAISLVFLSTAATCCIAQSDTVQPAVTMTPIENAWSILNTGLNTKSPELRTRAVHVLGELPGDAKAEEDAIAALKDTNPDVRAAAAQSLGEMGAKSAKPKLHDALQDTDPAVIIAAAHSLVTLGDDSGYDVYYAVLTGTQKTGTSLTDQEKKILHDPKKLAALGLQAGIGFVPFGGIAVTGFKMLTRDDTSPVLAAAALMLAKDPDPKSGEALADASANKDKWLVRAAAFDAIAKRGDPVLLKAAVAGLDDPKEEVNYSAAAAVIHLTDIKAHPVAAPRKSVPRKK
jgi:HEAT repeat protein